MITVIGREGCEYCENAKEILRMNNTPFEEKLIGIDILREEVLQNYPDQKKLPIILANGELLGGYTELLDYVYPPLKN